MKEIRIDVGVCTTISINLENVDFTGIQKVIFTVKNTPDYKAPALIEREFTEPKAYRIVISPEESIRLTNSAVYDFNKILADGSRHKITDNGKVVLRKSVGDCID